MLTSVASLAVPLAAVLLVASVIWPRVARRVDLLAVLVALGGAITARVALVATDAGDEVFRGTTVAWAFGLAGVAVGWWLLCSPGRARTPRRGVRVAAGAVAVVVALAAAASALGHPPDAGLVTSA